MPLAIEWGMTTVLVVDDESPIVELVRFTLEDEDLQVVEAQDGPEAVEMARATRPDLVLLDVQLPSLSGVEVCHRLRREPGLVSVPIIMLTAAGQASDRERGLAAGANEYLTKPFSPLALLTLVRSLLPEKRLWPDT